MTDDVLETLQDTRNLIVKGWCKQEFAMKANGDPCEIEDIDAAKYCLVGAISAAAYGDNELTEFYVTILCNRLGIAPFQSELIGWNDDEARTKADVLALLDAEIFYRQRRRVNS